MPTEIVHRVARRHQAALDVGWDARVVHRVAVRYMRRTEGLVPVEDEEGDEPVGDERSGKRAAGRFAARARL